MLYPGIILFLCLILPGNGILYGIVEKYSLYYNCTF